MMSNDTIYRQAAIDEIEYELEMINLALDSTTLGFNSRERLRQRKGEAREILNSIQQLPSAQQEFTTINKFIDHLEEIFAYIRESNGDDSVCRWCEFDGAYVGESGDWCNECPGFNRDDCFKLRDKIREKWIAEVTNTVPSAQPKPKTGRWIKATGMMPPEFHGHHCCSECGNFANMCPPFGNREDLSDFCPNCGLRMENG